ncbi:hypothetical protein [Chitinophaga vietnamensis]|uniref:hypothetical protein n=1 Tax=Chitinophaga vietnamensis TaxID=2593957 RepID=UPI0011789B92|nr:hypothetical protein [Chitinophaga vietnamensis]
MKKLFAILILGIIPVFFLTACIRNDAENLKLKDPSTDKKNVAKDVAILGTCDAESFGVYEGGPTDRPANSLGIQINSTGWSSAVVGYKEYNSTAPFTNYTIAAPTSSIITFASGIDALKTWDVQLTLTCSDGSVSTSSLHHDVMKGYDVGPSASNNVTLTQTSSPSGTITIKNNFSFPIYSGLTSYPSNTILYPAQMIAPGAQLSYSSLAAGRYGVLLNKFTTFPGAQAFTRVLTL